MSRDPGLQAERTGLSWQRTLLTTLVVAVFAWRDALLSLDAAPDGFAAARAVVGAALVSIGVFLIAAMTASRNRALRRSSALFATVQRVRIASLAAVLVAAGVVLLVAS